MHGVTNNSKMNRKSVEELVTIIIPLYEVEQYLDDCLESVVNQTYRNLEIILVYDESVDNTLEICRAWCRKDGRIRLIISKKRSGLGMARNLGLAEAQGKYIVYLDSDDWMEEDFIEALYIEISSHNVDYVSSRGYYKAYPDSEQCHNSVLAGEYCDDTMREALLIADSPCVWKKIYRKEWLLQNGLTNPPLYCYEDWGMYPCVIRQAKKVRVIDKVGVHYRCFREGSLTDSSSIRRLLTGYEDAMWYFFEYLERHGLRRVDERKLAYFCIRDYYCRWDQAVEEEDWEAQQRLISIKTNVLEKEVGWFDLEKYRYIAFGGFSLRWEMHKALFGTKRLYRHYCFSSIISLMSKCPPVEIEHENPFRQEQIGYDIASNLLEELKEAGDDMLLFLDFMEERYDIMEIADGKFLTVSEAFMEIDKSKITYKRILKWGSSEYLAIWKKCCLEFIDYIRKYLGKNRVVYVANRMSLGYGNLNDIEKYEEGEEIVIVNEVLSEMEEFFLLHFQGVTRIVPDSRFAFTEKNFRLGCNPQYMNNIYYTTVGAELLSRIMEV